MESFNHKSIINKLFKANQENNEEFDEFTKLNISKEEIDELFEKQFLIKHNSCSSLFCKSNQLQKQISFYNPLFKDNQKEGKNLVELFTNKNQNDISKYITFLILNNPISDKNYIFKRSAIIQFYLKNQNDQHLIIFNKLKEIENDILWVLKNSINKNTSKERNIIDSTLFYESPFLQILNKNYYFQTAYYFYNLYFYPIYQFIQPFFVFIISYFIMNQVGKRFGVQLPFSFFIKMAKQQFTNFFNFKSESNTWYGKTFHIFSKILYILLTVYSIVQMIYQRIFINKITNFIHLKLKVISEMFDSINQLKNDNLIEFEKPKWVNNFLQKDFYSQEPSYFINKGKIVKDYFSLLNQPEINDFIKQSWINISLLNSFYNISLNIKENNKIVFLNESNFGNDVKNIKINEGFHPLLDNGVSNSYDSVKSVNIVTGANASGKSVYLKMIGTNILLAHSFGFVFAKEVELPVLNRLMIHMGNQDIVGEKSLFEAEVINANEILKGISDEERGLYIFDELFSSTNPKEGKKTTENYIKKMGEFQNQICILSTHYSVKELAKSKIKKKTEFRRLGKNFKVLKGINKVKGGVKIFEKLIDGLNNKQIEVKENNKT